VQVPIYLCTAHYYLNDLTLDLAPTWVIPGSHKSGRALAWGKDPDPQWQGRKLEPVLCKAGDVVFFRCELWHTGSKNATLDQTRYLLQVHYSHRWVAQHFVPSFEFPWNPEIVAAATPRQRRLLGETHYGGLRLNPIDNPWCPNGVNGMNTEPASAIVVGSGQYHRCCGDALKTHDKSHRTTYFRCGRQSGHRSRDGAHGGAGRRGCFS
jgi:hypothetical protein